MLFRSLYLDSTWTDGDLVPIFNSDLNLDDTLNAFIIEDDVIPVAMGTDLKRGYTIKADSVEAGTASSTLEYIMKQNANHMLALTSNANVGIVNVTVFWTWYVS